MKSRALPVLVVLTTALPVIGCGDDEKPGTGAGASGAGGGAARTNSEGGAGTASGAAGLAQSGAGTGGGSDSGGSSGAAGTGQGGSGARPGGSSDHGDFPAINLMDDARKLSDSDKGLLCDWVNETLGGYGLVTDCGSITVSNDDDQAQCVATRFKYNCKVTVQEVRNCTLVTAPGHACSTDFQECHPLRCIE